MKQRQRGVGLIEILISILIFSFGILGLVGLQARAVSYSTAAEDTNRAALLANDASSQMWNSGSLTLSPAALAAWKARVADTATSGLPNGVGDIKVGPNPTGPGNAADIIITWSAPSTPTKVNRYVTQVTF